LGDEIDEGRRLLGIDERPGVPGMYWLPALRPSTLDAATPLTLAAGQVVRGRRPRARGRVLLPQRQLPFEIDDTLGFCQLPLAFGEFAAQSIVLLLQPFLGIRELLSHRPRHAPTRYAHRVNLYRP
jgi:hypothetical protein